MTKFYHGGAPGFQAGDLLEPDPDCDTVYFTENRLYAKFFASLGRGWLYAVEPVGEYERSKSDHMESLTSGHLRVVRVIEKAVKLTPNEVRQIRRSELRFRKEMQQ